MCGPVGYWSPAIASPFALPEISSAPDLAVMTSARSVATASSHGASRVTSECERRPSVPARSQNVVPVTLMLCEYGNECDSALVGVRIETYDVDAFASAKRCQPLEKTTQGGGQLHAMTTDRQRRWRGLRRAFTPRVCGARCEESWPR